MHLLFSESIVSRQLLKNISFTLAHSLWQGMLAAVLAMLILSAAKKASAAVRYRLLFANFLLFCAAVVVTFLLQPVAEKTTVMAAQITSGTVVQIHTGAYTESGAGGFSGIVNFLNEYSPAIVLAWMLLTLFRLAQLVAGYWTVNKIKKTQVTGAGEFWNKRLQQLAAAVKVTKPVTLLQSCIVKTPAVVSYFKPVILMPASLLTSLPQDEVEAVLLHELSHIRRNDFIANCWQILIETIFFFNPFVFWISGLIREERENCCDDLAVSQLSNKAVLIKAMVSCREFDMQQSSRFALAFGRQKGHLLNRVKRIVSNTPRPFYAAEKFLLFLSVSFLIIIVTLPLQAFQKNGAADKTTFSRDISDTIPKNANMNDETSGTVKMLNGVPHAQYVFRRSNVVYKVEKVQDKIVSAEIGGKPVKAEEMQKQLPYFNSLIAEYESIINQPMAKLNPVSGLSTADIAELDSAQKIPASLAPVAGVNGTAPVSGVKGKEPVSGLNGTAPVGGLSGNMAGLKSPGAENDLKAGVNIANYFDKGYRIVVQGSDVIKVYYNGKALTAEQIKEKKAEIDSIVKSAGK